MAMSMSDLKPGTRVVDLGYPQPSRVLVVVKPVPGGYRPTVECHAEDDPHRRAHCWVTSLDPAPVPHPDYPARTYRWEDLRDTTAGEPGVSGGGMTGQLTPQGMARTVVARDGNNITFRNHPNGFEWSKDINPDHPILRVDCTAAKEQ